MKNGEHLVHYILAKPLHTDVGSMGIPAFDQGKSLVSWQPWLFCSLYYTHGLVVVGSAAHWCLSLRCLLDWWSVSEICISWKYICDTIDLMETGTVVKVEQCGY